MSHGLLKTDFQHFFGFENDSCGDFNTFQNFDFLQILFHFFKILVSAGRVITCF